MMMIAFINVTSGLVPLIESLCAQSIFVRFEIIGGLRPHLFLFFRREKCVEDDMESEKNIYLWSFDSGNRTRAAQLVT